MDFQKKVEAERKASMAKIIQLASLYVLQGSKLATCISLFSYTVSIVLSAITIHTYVSTIQSYVCSSSMYVTPNFRVHMHSRTKSETINLKKLTQTSFAN